MPIYVMACNECGKTQEFLSREFVVPHKECCGKPMQQVFCPPAVHYKGAGFATTEARGITGRKRKPNIKIGLKSDLPPEEQERMK